MNLLKNLYPYNNHNYMTFLHKKNNCRKINHLNIFEKIYVGKMLII